MTGYENTAAAKVEVGQGATIDALGNVDISANATISDLPAIAHFIDMSGYAKAAVQLDGAITGNNVKVDAKAQAVYTNNNHGNLMDLINNLSGPLGVTVKSNLTGTIWNILDKAGKINGKVDILNKIVNLQKGSVAYQFGQAFCYFRHDFFTLVIHCILFLSAKLCCLL